MGITHNTGITEYLMYGTSTDPDTYAGRVTGGELRADSGLSWQGSVGGKHASNFGIWAGGGTATLDVYNSTLLAFAKRSSYTSPSLTTLCFGGGLIGGNNVEFKQTGCKLNSFDVSLAIGGIMTATVEWFAMAQADDMIASGPTQNGSVWRWFQGQCTFNGSTYSLQSAKCSLNNGLQRIADIETTTAGSLMLPGDLAIGPEKVTAAFEMLAKPGTAMNLHQDGGVTGLSALIQASDGTHTLSFTLANLAGRSTRLPFASNEGLVVFSLDLEAEPNNSTSLTIAYS